MRARLALCLALLAQPAAADDPRVVADIPPVAALARMVLGDEAPVFTLLPPGASPHDHALKPGDARALEDADVVIWIGPALTPNLEKALETLSADAKRLTLSDLPGTTLLAPRETAIFESAHSDHDHRDHGHGDHDHSDAHDHGHDDDHAAQDHGDKDAHDHGPDHAHEHAHDHDGPFDPHLWLDPENAILWLDTLAETFAAQDPEAREAYVANAEAGKTAIAEAADRARATLAGLESPLAVLHDAFYYYEEAFGLTNLGALTPSDAAQPSPRRMAELRDVLPDGTCLLVEPQYDPRLVDALGAEIKVAEIDALGATMAQDATLYPALIEGIAARIAACD